MNTTLQIVESSHVVRFRDQEQRLFTYSLHDSTVSLARQSVASYALDRADSLAHVHTIERDEFERANTRVVRDSVYENYAQNRHSIKRNQTQTFARATIDSCFTTFSTVARFTINVNNVKRDKCVRIVRKVEFDEAYNASAEHDLQIAQDCRAQSIEIMQMIDDAQKLRAKIASCITLFHKMKESADKETRDKAFAALNAAKKRKILLAELLESLNCADLFD